MKILIIEDEVPAQQMLLRLIQKYYPDFEVVATLESITASAIWLSRNTADLIFMDVELSDGVCFELFKRVNIEVPVIVTTAYEHYALMAFKTKCIEYLLKPIDELEFTQAVERCIKIRKAHFTATQINKIISDSTPTQYRQRITIKLGGQIIVVEMSNIAYFFSEEKSNYVVTYDKKQYLLDFSLESIEPQLNPSLFFRLNRGCIVSLSAINNISKYFNSRLRISLNPPSLEPQIVSRARVAAFLEWLDGQVR